MGQSDFLDLGGWNAQCFRCGMKRKAGTLRRQWQGYWVCPEHWEPRQPQDFVRGVKDTQTVPWSQPDNWTFTGPGLLLCTVTGKSAIPSLMMPGCAIPSNSKVDIFA